MIKILFFLLISIFYKFCLCLIYFHFIHFMSQFDMCVHLKLFRKLMCFLLCRLNRSHGLCIDIIDCLYYKFYRVDRATSHFSLKYLSMYINLVWLYESLQGSFGSVRSFLCVSLAKESQRKLLSCK